jgi:hypothetical protein
MGISDCYSMHKDITEHVSIFPCSLEHVVQWALALAKWMDERYKDFSDFFLYGLFGLFFVYNFAARLHWPLVSNVDKEVICFAVVLCADWVLCVCLSEIRMHTNTQCYAHILAHTRTH